MRRTESRRLRRLDEYDEQYDERSRVAHQRCDDESDDEK